MLVGLLAALSASVLFGSMFVPINGIPTGDGFSAQLFLCLGQFVVSTAFHLMLMAPSIQPIAMVSGINWALANSMAIPIMNRLGMALSVLVWSTVSCLIGWATSRFGMFGLPAAVPASLLLNYVGIIVLITGGVMYVFVKSNVKSQEIVEHTDKEKQMPNSEKTESSVVEISLLERALALLAALLCGTLYGSMWIPVNHIKAHLDQYPNSPKDFPPYLFSFFTGIMCTSAIIFVVYSFVKRGKPAMNPEAAVPSLAAGAIGAGGMISFVMAIDRLGPSIAYPICVMAPGLVVSMWSILYFREITGKRNFIFLSIAYGFTFVGVTLITVSKEVRFP
ncbi:hypothetical protein Q1695_010297 [Nippostrongylus brasiliensis]|nr:hypothetical protein Q1695_010297 [Nippostrongylus brasiliensis]